MSVSLCDLSHIYSNTISLNVTQECWTSCLICWLFVSFTYVWLIKELLQSIATTLRANPTERMSSLMAADVRGTESRAREPLRAIEWTQTSGKFALEDPNSDQVSAPEKDFVFTEYNNGSRTSLLKIRCILFPLKTHLSSHLCFFIPNVKFWHQL